MRYHLYLISLCLLVFNNNLLSQCPEGNITFNSQNAIDNFTAEFPNCTEINGNLFIQSDNPEIPILNLSGLRNITQIKGSLSIMGTRVNHLSGLDNLHTIEGTFHLSGNAQLASLLGLEKLTTIGEDFSLFQNSRLETVGSLASLSQVGRDFVIFEQAALMHLNGLQNLLSVGGEVAVVDNFSLSDIDSLEGLLNIGGGITLDGNSSLETLNGFGNLESIGGSLEIVNNSSLAICNNEFICAYLSDSTNDIIADNKEGCSTIFEIGEACADGGNDCPLEADFTYETDGLDVLFTAATSNTELITSYAYAVGENGINISSLTESISHTYAAPGEYEVRLTITAECGSESITKTIVVDGTPSCEDFGADYTIENTSNNLANGRVELVPFIGVDITNVAINSDLVFEFVDSIFVATDVPAGNYTIEFIDVVKDCSVAYNITLINQADCSDFSVTIQQVNTECYGQFAAIIKEGIAPYQYQWTSDGFHIDATFNGRAEYVGTQLLTVIDAVGCADTVLYMVQPSDNLEAVFTYEIINDSIQLENTSFGNIISFQWTSTTELPVNNQLPLPPPGAYEICLIVENDCGNTDEHCTTILIEETDTSSTTDLPDILQPYGWLGNQTDLENCFNTTISIYTQGIYTYIYIEDDNGKTLYNSAGELYCQDRPDLNCLDYYTEELVDKWTCNPSPIIDADQDGTPATEDENDNDPCIPIATLDSCMEQPPTSQLFTDYPSLHTIVDLDDCEGEKITAYRTPTGFVYFLLESTSGTTLYNAQGAFYCNQTPSYDCVALYNLTEIFGTWECGATFMDADQDGIASDTDPNDNDPCIPNNNSETCQTVGELPQLFQEYDWLQNETGINPFNCTGETITIYQTGPYIYLYVETNDSFTMYSETGQFYCSGSPTYNCPELYNLTNIIGSWSCGEAVTDRDNDGTLSDVDPDDADPCIPNKEVTACSAGGTVPPVFEEYNWLSNELDPFDCQGGMVQVYRSSGYVYVFVETLTSAKLFNANGLPYCTNSPGYNCREFYVVEEIISTWTCGDNTIDEDRDGIPADTDPNDKDPCIPNNNTPACTSGGEVPAIFVTYDWLENYVDPFDCSTERITVYVSGIYKYINVETATSTILYTEAEAIQCTSGPGYDCVALYGFSEIASVWSCGEEGSIFTAESTSRDNQTKVFSTPFSNDFIVFPNPSTGHVFIEFQKEADSLQTVRIVNLQGNVIASQTLSNNSRQQLSFDLSQTAAGVYLVQLLSKEGSQTKRLIIE